jgi:hypothetical protein
MDFSPMDWGMGLNASREALRCGGLLLALTVLGCGRNDKLTPVRGQVFYHGRPLAGGTIVFTPDAERGGHGPLACGEIGADGRYTLHTGDNLGAVPGWHRITIAPPASPTQTAAPPAIALPRRYGVPEQSGLLREIKADAAADQDFHLE